MISARLAAAVLGLAWSAMPARAVTIDCARASAVPGGVATVAVTLTSGPGERVAGTQNDLEYDGAVLTVTPADCAINLAIGEGTAADKRLSSGVLSDPQRLRNIVVSTENVEPIPDGLLYTCRFHVAPDASLGDITLRNTKLIAGDPQGVRLPVSGTDCTITVMAATPAPTPTPTPMCTRDEDCPPGQICDPQTNTCVTPRPTATPTPMCTRDEDCPPGQICDPQTNTCVTPRPTATPTRRRGGGGGCDCNIDAGAPSGGPSQALVLLIPAVLLWLRRRSSGYGLRN